MTDAEEPTAERPSADGRAQREPDDETDRPDTTDPDADPGGAGAHERPGQDHGHALAELARVTSPPPPPRRTGVFLDPADLREHVGELLRAILGGYEVDAFGNFTFAHEGARVVVTIGRSPIGPQVGVFSVTNLEVDLTPELGQYLLTANHTLAFGAFSYDVANRAVWLRHSLHGSTLDLPELQSAVAAVATTASQVDGAIRERFGGRLFEDAPDDVQRRVEPPDTSQDGPPNATGYL